MANKDKDEEIRTDETEVEATEIVEETEDEATETETVEETETETAEEEETEEETETEEPTEDVVEPEEEPETEPEPKEEPKAQEKPKTTKRTVRKVAKKKETVEDETDKELEDYIAKKEAAKAEEKKFTQADFDKALTRALAKKLPPKEEMEQFKHWKEEQQTLEEKMDALKSKYADLKTENDRLSHENAVIKAGVQTDAVDFVVFKVEKMEGDFEDNLKDYLDSHKKYTTPKTTVVEGAEHKAKPKASISKAELDRMSYQERATYKAQHPEEYRKAMLAR